MTAVLVVGAIAVVGAVVARVTWRRPADERHSIQSHQQTLETLRSMADRRPGDRDRAPASGTDAVPGAPARPPRARPGPVHAGPARPAQARSAQARPGSVRAPAPAPSNGHTGDELVFVDDAAGPSTPRANGLARPSVLALPGALPRAGRRHGRRGRSRTRVVGRLVPVVGAIVVLGIVVGAAVALAPSHRVPTASHRTDSRPKTSTHVTNPRPTVPPPLQVTPTSSTSITAAYGAPATGYTVALRASGLCWVQATQASTGTVVWTGTLLSGQTRSIPATGSLVLRIGAANDVSVTLNGEQVVLPAGFQSPFDMRFEST